MTLSEYLASKNLSVSEFARQLGTSRQCVHNWASGSVYPRRKVAERIAEVTQGAVTANDFVSDAARAPS